MMRILFLILAVFLSSCASKDEDVSKVPAEELYNRGMYELEHEQYTRAAETFSSVEREHPYSPWSVNAKIMEAYAYYAKSKYDDALMVLHQFVRLHPGHKEAPYAYYLIALSFYEQISDIKRDQRYTEMARAAFSELLARYPDSTYARDARIKLDLVNDHLAGKEMDVGRYYQKRKDFAAAINRFNKVVVEYDRTVHIEEALFRLAESYYAIGAVDEAKKYAAVLGHNYPSSKWYKYSYDLLK